MPVLAFLLACAVQVPSIERAWVAELEDVVICPPVSHGNLVITAGQHGIVSAWKIDTGDEAWSTTLKASISTGPVLFKDRLFVPGWPLSAVLDPATGKVLREGPRASQAVVGASRLYLLNAITFADGFLLGSSDTVTGFDPVGGRTLWTETFKPGVTMAIEAGSRLLLVSGRKIIAVDPATGRKQGEAEHVLLKASHQGIFQRDRLFLVGRGNKSVFCVNPKTLKETWSVTIEGMVNDIEPLLVSDRLILFPLPDVVALDGATGKVAWSCRLDGETSFSLAPPVLRGTEAIVGVKGTLKAVDAKAGSATWSLGAGPPSGTSPVPQPIWSGDRLLYVVGENLYCFKPK